MLITAHRCTPYEQVASAAEMLEAASERLEALKQDGRVVSETLVRLDGEVGELTRADHDYEQVCGAIGMIGVGMAGGCGWAAGGQ